MRKVTVSKYAYGFMCAVTCAQTVHGSIFANEAHNKHAVYLADGYGIIP